MERDYNGPTNIIVHDVIQGTPLEKETCRRNSGDGIILLHQNHNEELTHSDWRKVHSNYLYGKIGKLWDFPHAFLLHLFKNQLLRCSSAWTPELNHEEYGRTLPCSPVVFVFPLELNSSQNVHVHSAVRQIALETSSHNLPSLAQQTQFMNRHLISQPNKHMFPWLIIRVNMA